MGRWLVSTRRVGEVLAVEARQDGMRVILVGVGAGAQTRLAAAIEQALRAPADDPVYDPVPAPVGALAAALVAWREELRSVPAPGDLGAMIFLESPGFGWLAHLGGTEPRIRAGSGPLTVPRFVVGDRSDGATCAAFDARECPRAEIRWASNAGGASAPSVTVDAEWCPAMEEPDPADLSRLEAAAAGSEADPLPLSSDSRVAADGPAAATPSDPARGFFLWLDRVVAKRRSAEPSTETASGTQRAAQSSPVLEPEVPDTAPPIPSAEGEASRAPRSGLRGDEDQIEPIAPTGSHSPPRPGIASTPAALPPTGAVIPGQLEAGPVTQNPDRGPRPGGPSPEPATEVEPSAGEAAHEVPDAASAPPPVSAPDRVRPQRRPLRPAWPSREELEPRRPAWKRIAPAAALVTLLFAAGWWLGRIQGKDSAGAPVVARWLSALGLGRPHFDCVVRSWPNGAWISVDGKTLGRRTPTTVELSPGSHHVEVSLPELGSAAFSVRGERGDRANLDAQLWGSMVVNAATGGEPIEVTVDGESHGVAPVEIKRLAPGPHQVEFSSPGLASMSQTVMVRVNQSSEINARLLRTQGSGLIEVRSSIAGDRGVEPLDGAVVWVDGERRGATPLTLELPRGPHSIRAAYQGEEAPVQVIDLPGGNQRFANFQFGSGMGHPVLTLQLPAAPMPRDRPTVVSATLEGVPGDVREMWMHVRTPEGTWRRYPMSVMSGPGGAVGVAVFPLALLDLQGRAPFYVSAATTLGDEYFTELQNAAKLQPAPRPRS